MRLYESHDEGFGVPNNTISRHATAYATNARFVVFLGTFARPAQEVWLPGNDLQDPARYPRHSGTLVIPQLNLLHEAHVQQNESLTHPQDLDAPLRIAAQRKLHSYRQQYADNQNISFLPAIMTTSSRIHC